MSASWDSADIAAAGMEVVHAMRFEIIFLTVFALVWGAGRLLGLGRPSRAPAKGQQKPRPPRAPPRVAGPGLRSGVGEIDLRNPSREQLRDPAWLCAAVQQVSRAWNARSIELYREACRAGFDVTALPPADGAAFFASLVCAAIRIGQPSEALRLLIDCRQKGPGIPLSLFASATKLCTSKQMFKECLSIYDFVYEDKALVIDDRTIWSCLLFCAVEARAFQRCHFFFDRLKACGPASNKDFGNMIRCVSTQGDWQSSLALIVEMREAGVEVDSVVYNTTLATCVTASQTDRARELLREMESAGGVADVITYNTLAKGYAKLGRLDDCFDLYEHMRSKGIVASQVTYGILLNCCINEKHMEKAAEVFDTMTKEGCVMNTVLFTTLIKGFARADRIDKAMEVFDQMRTHQGRGVTPDLITFSILIKANCDAGRMGAALELRESMLRMDLAPDEVVFNNLLSGCINTPNMELARRLYADMIQGGVRPSNATFSIMIRVYAACKGLDAAVDMMRTEPELRGVECEPRLFVQLAQACLRERQGRRAVEVYKMLAQHSEPTMAINSNILGMCVKLNMLDTAAEIVAVANTAGGKIDPRDSERLKAVPLRKRRPGGAEAAGSASAW